MTIDYPNIRKAIHCPVCKLDKPAGNIVCWACYGRYLFRFGIPKAITIKLDFVEDVLSITRECANARGYLAARPALRIVKS